MAQVTPLSITSACVDAPSGRFLDVSGTHQAGVDCIGWWGTTQGSGDGSYSPDAPVRRDQMATFVARSLELSGFGLPDDAPSSFADTAGNTHAAAIDQLADLGVVGGTADGGYNPSGTVTRAQMASFLARAWQARTGEDLVKGGVSFPDIDGNVHADNIIRIATAGLTGGTASGDYDPAGKVTRAQMGTFLARLLALLVNEDVTAYPPANPVPLPEVTPPVGGVTEMGRYNDPLILGTHQVSIAAGQSQLYTTPVSSRHADVNVWFHDGPATDDQDYDCPPFGREGISMALQVGMPGQEINEDTRYDFGANDCGFGVTSVDPWTDGDGHQGNQVQVHIRNDSVPTLTRQMHIGQRGAFKLAVHPAGTTATYAFDTTTSATSATIGFMHPTANWSYGVQVEEASTLTYMDSPLTHGREEPTCSEYLFVIHYDTVAGNVDHHELPLVSDGDRCGYELDVAGPAHLFDYLWSDARLEVTVAPAN